MEKAAISEDKKKHHFVLVHGSCHGAWCWYKLKPLLESAGNRVTALDMAASGVNMKRIEDVPTSYDYSEPLLDFLSSLAPDDEKVILVGHSFGGLNLSVAMEKFPGKISVAVFLTAFMPDTEHAPSYVLDEYFASLPASALLDTQFLTYGSSDQPLTSLLFGPEFLSSRLYQLCPVEDLELCKMLIRPSSLFLENLSTLNKFSNGGYGCVPRVFIICHEDKGITKEFQRWMVENSRPVEVFEITEADHMPMLCKPRELCDCLKEEKFDAVWMMSAQNWMSRLVFWSSGHTKEDARVLCKTNLF